MIEMPGQGSTRQNCMVCHTDLNLACKTCDTCKKEQPHKLRLEKKLKKFDQKRESWVQMQTNKQTNKNIGLPLIYRMKLCCWYAISCIVFMQVIFQVLLYF